MISIPISITIDPSALPSGPEGKPGVGVGRSVTEFGAVGDGVADDAAAIQTAFNWLVETPFRKLLFPASFRWRVGTTCTADFGAQFGGQIIMDSPITPDPGIGDAFHIINGRYLTLKLWVHEGGQTADYSQPNPVGADQAFLIRGVRDADVWVKAYNYKGRVVRLTKEMPGEAKTSKLTFHTFRTGDYPPNGCGQAVYVDASSAVATFGACYWFWDDYGPIFHETDDIAIHSVDAGWRTNHGMIIQGCRSVWIGSLACGDETEAINLVTIKSSPTKRSANIWVGSLFAQMAKKGLVLENIGAAGDVAGITIGALYTRYNSEHGLHMTACRGVKIAHQSDQDRVPVETVGTCKNVDLHARILGARRQAIIIGSGAYQLNVSGNIQNPNSDNVAGTPVIDINSTSRDIDFSHMVIESANANYAYDLQAGNDVIISDGGLYLSGATVPFGPVLPKATRNVRNYQM